MTAAQGTIISKGESYPLQACRCLVRPLISRPKVNEGKRGRLIERLIRLRSQLILIREGLCGMGLHKFLRL